MPMYVLIACEFSGIVREAFRARGHHAWSCDLLPSEIPGQHVQADVRTLLNYPWDLIIAHPPCTHLANSGNRWWAGTPQRQEALSFIAVLANAPAGKLALENPVGAINALLKPTQIIQPWQFGHGETKETCLWLRNLPKLQPTCIVPGRHPRVHYEGESKIRWKHRSRTYPGIAQAMAEQWG